MSQSSINVLDLAVSKGVELKKAATTQGGEYHSPCPGCGGRDRFHVWPEQNAGGGSYWCRQCGKGGDNIQFLIDFSGLSYPEACAQLEIEPAARQPFKAPNLPGRNTHARTTTPASKPVMKPPPDLWMEKAKKLTNWAYENLLKNKAELKRLSARGIDKNAVAKYRLGWNPEDLWRPRPSWGLEQVLKDNGRPKMMWFPAGLIIPKSNGEQIVRLRIRRPAGEPRYYLIPGSSVETMCASREGRAVVVVESELDLMMIDAAAGDVVSPIALGSSSIKPDQAASGLIRNAVVVLNALDFDDAGAKAQRWWFDNVPDAKRWPVPVGKDPGDAFVAGVDIREWIISGLPEAWFFGPSVLDSKKQGRGEAEGSQQAPERPVGLPAQLGELFDLLKRFPVAILNRYDRLKLLEDKEWARRNWEVSKRISRLVYMDTDVFRYLASHPDEKIYAKNLIYDRSGEQRAGKRI